MKTTTLQFIEKSKHYLYLFTIALLVLLSGLAFIHAIFNDTHMDFFSAVSGAPKLALLVLCAGAVLAFLLLFLYRKLSVLPEKRQRLLLGILALFCIALQYVLLFTLRVTLRYDHLMVFDQALEIFRTGEISLTYGENYFAQYPFNIPITLFNYGILNIAKLIGIPESGYMLTVQCVYLLGVDLAAFFSYKIARILRSQKTATFFALLCFFNPLMYMYGFGCYTTILMLPFLMGNLLFFICVLREKRLKKKLVMAFLFGCTFMAGFYIRMNLLITLITFIGYVVLHVRNADTFVEKKIHGLYVFLAAAAAAVLCMTAYPALEARHVHGDYSDTELPPSYYFLFSSRLESLGSYNEEDHLFIQSFDTAEEKDKAAWSALFARLSENGLSGNAFLFDYKLSFTWSDGIDDYPEFIHTTENYGTLHSFLGGSRKDFFALYCHIYHVMTMALLVYAAVLALKKRCNTPFYMIYLNLLGAMLFHILWEAGWAYSISFTMLVLLLSSEGISSLEERLSAKSAAGRRYARITLAAGILALGIGALHVKDLFTVPFKQMEYAVVQDMSEGEDLMPLLTGETVSQTFVTDRPFNHIGCKVLNPAGEANASSYRIDLLDKDGTVLGSRSLQGGEVLNKDYCYVKFDSVIPDKKTEYEIRITALSADEDNSLTFLYYNSGNWDIYPAGGMTGLNASEKSDLTFVVYDSVTKCFFN